MDSGRQQWRNGILKKIIIFLLLVPLYTNVYAATYYVKTGGDNAKDGLSDANAWETIVKVNGFTFSPGDTIQFNKGDTWSDKTLQIANSGTSGNYITIGAYGTGDDPIISGGDTTACIYITDQNYIKVENMRATGYALNTGVNINNANYITLDGCEIDNNVNQGVRVQALNNENVSNITVQNCDIHDNGRAGLQFEMGDADANESGKISTVTLFNNSIYSNTSQGLFIKSLYAQGGLEHWMSNATITYNDVYSNGNTGMTIGCVGNESGDNYVAYNNVYGNGIIEEAAGRNGIGIGNVSDCIIEYNTSYNNKSWTIDGVGIIIDVIRDGFWQPSHDCIVRNNTCYDHDYIKDQVPYDGGTGDTSGNSAGIALIGGVYNIQVYNNICYNNTTGIWVAGSNVDFPTANNEIYNNTLTGNRIGFHCDFNYGSTGGLFENNAVANNTKTGDGATGNWGIYIENDAIELSDFNCVYNSGTSYYNHTEGGNSITSNPLLGSNYTLNVGSPCIGTGLAIDDVVSDYRGAGRILNDMGAMAYATFIQDCVVQDCTIN